jgi:hypothetical protein
MLPLLVLLALVPGGVVHADGRVGAFRIDRTTEAQIRTAYGKPARIEPVYNDVTRRKTGRTLVYRCGRGCSTRYSISVATGRLSDFETSSPRFRTEHGSHPGMSAARAVRLEGKRLVPGCGDALYVHLRWDGHHAFVLTATHGRIDGIAYLGPHTVFYEGLC